LAVKSCGSRSSAFASAVAPTAVESRPNALLSNPKAVVFKDNAAADEPNAVAPCPPLAALPAPIAMESWISVVALLPIAIERRPYALV
jgi:hypothetical protein